MDKILTAFDFDNVVALVQGKNGFEVKDRRKEKSRLKTYPKCFIGACPSVRLLIPFPFPFPS